MYMHLFQGRWFKMVRDRSHILFSRYKSLIELMQSYMTDALFFSLLLDSGALWYPELLNASSHKFPLATQAVPQLIGKYQGTRNKTIC